MATPPHAPHEVIIPLEKPFIDARGVIQPLCGTEVSDVAIITSRKGAVRANHFHKTDWHYCYVVSGAIDYLYREVGSTAEPKTVHIKAGQLFYSPPNLEHAMKFPEDTTFVVMSRNSRAHEDYEADVVRVPLA